jgi:hypothetical protein
MEGMMSLLNLSCQHQQHVLREDHGHAGACTHVNHATTLTAQGLPSPVQ